MEVTVHSCTDQLHSFHGNKNFGLNDEGYNKAMDWINKHQEWRGGERYEYFGIDMEIKFMWDVTEKEFRELMRPGDDDADDLTDYFGAVFFGNYKLEFVWNDVAGAYNNMFWYGREDVPDGAYAYLEDGTPYEEIDPPFVIPKRRTFASFAKNVEAQIIKWLNDNPEYIEDALVETNPVKWYPDGQCNVTRDITRIA
jgi:hypothetical protein